MFAIAGSGFGLYGYLPALIDSIGETIVLPTEYREKFRARAELSRYRDAVFWADSLDEAFSRADGAVIAVRPADQARLVSSCLRLNGIQRLVLEKPLAPDPVTAHKLMDSLLASGKKFRIGYTFLYVPWFAGSGGLAACLPSGKRLSIQWKFHAHHFAHGLNNWKRFSASGGGVLRFYGIQILAMLSDMGYHDVAFSTTSGANPEEAERWEAEFLGDSLPVCHLIVDCRSTDSEFSIDLSTDEEERFALRLESPFALDGSQRGHNNADQRVAPLRHLLRSFKSEDSALYTVYEATNRLWEKVEQATNFATRSVNT